ncbi:MAG: hypothetical protein K8S97_15745 [Anaerolineae bacterium]|nr:hypothetical protein [Anaerolineae bacterium]
MSAADGVDLDYFWRSCMYDLRSPLNLAQAAHALLCMEPDLTDEERANLQVIVTDGLTRVRSHLELFDEAFRVSREQHVTGAEKGVSPCPTQLFQLPSQGSKLDE